MTAKTTENDRRISLQFCHFEEWIPRKFPDFPAFSSIFRAYSAKKYPRYIEYRGFVMLISGNIP